MGEDFVIEARHVRKSFGDVDVLKGLDLQVRRGTMFALLGPNGAGKSTMVRILSTLLRPDAGTVRIDGFDVVDQSAAVRDRMGMDASTPDAFAAVVPVPDDAPLIDRLVAWNGRRP